MRKVDFLIVGGSAAGTTAAEVIRLLLPNSTITILSGENHQQYSRVLIPHYIRHKVEREQVFLKKPDWYSERKIELVKTTHATGLNPEKHEVKASNGEIYQYSKLLVAIGGYVVRLAVPGSDLGNILYMRTIEDADRIIDVASKSKKGVIVGGGFIGLEFCSCFKLNGVDEVTVLVKEPYYWEGKLDESSSKVLSNTLAKNGIKILVKEEVDRFEAKGETKLLGSVITKSGKTFDAELVGVGIGIKSDLSWLERSGITIKRAIVTNEYLEVNLADVYAAGDCAEFRDVVFDRQHIMGNWANATSQGLAVGRTMAGQKTVFETASSYSINFFDGFCSFVGVSDVKFADEVISRGSVENGKMTRIFIKTINNVMRVVGATVINDPAEVGPLTSAVKGKVDISAHKNEIGNSDFDLKNLLS